MITREARLAMDDKLVQFAAGRAPGRERPRMRPCLRCGRPRMSTRADRMHERCTDGVSTRFSAAELKRIDRWLAKNAPVERTPRVTRQPVKKDPLPTARITASPRPRPPKAARRPRSPRPAGWSYRAHDPVPTEAQVATMDSNTRCLWRRELRRRGVEIPAYLAPQPGTYVRTEAHNRRMAEIIRARAANKETAA